MANGTLLSIVVELPVPLSYWRVMTRSAGSWASVRMQIIARVYLDYLDRYAQATIDGVVYYRQLLEKCRDLPRGCRFLFFGGSAVSLSDNEWP